MTLIAIVYSSGNGHTQLIAEHVAKGVANVTGTEVDLIRITADELGPDGRWQNTEIMERLRAADAIIFGAPTYMGSAHGLFKLFLEDAFTPWLGQEWKDKIAAGFTNSGSRSGDKLMTLEQFAVFAAQMGMIWVGVGDPPGGNRINATHLEVNHLGSWLGLMVQSPSADGEGTKGIAGEGDRLTAERFGQRVARATMRWSLGAERYPATAIPASEARRRNLAGLEEWHRFQD